MSLLSVLLGAELAAKGDSVMPATDTTFVYPVGVELVQDTDPEAVGYLQPLFADPDAMPRDLAPLLTTGDGNCAVHAVSRALWGVEIYHGLLRDGLLNELLQHSAWYRERFGLPPVGTDCDEWDQLLAQAGQDRERLEMRHFLALSNLIRRPIVVLAGPADVAEFGSGDGGVAATLLPLRHAPEACAARLPVVLAWSTTHKVHFVPLVAVEGQQRVAIPRPKVAFSLPVEGSEASLVDRFLDFAALPKHAEAHSLLKSRAQEQRLREAQAASRQATSRDNVLRLIEMYNALLRQRARELLLQKQRLAAKLAATAQRYPYPEDGTMHDIVVPIQLGKSVAFACTEYGADHMMAAARFIVSHGISMRFVNPLATYLENAEQVFLAAGGVRPPGLAPGDIPPLASVPSDTASAVLVSLGATELPWKGAPVRFDKRPTEAIMTELLQLVTQKGGNADAVKRLVFDADRFIQGMRHTTADAQQLLVCFANLLFVLSDTPIPLCALDALRFLVLAPIVNQTCGTLSFINKLSKLMTSATTPFICHVSFLHFIVNAFSIDSIMDEVVPVPLLREYLTILSKSRSQLIRKPLAAVLFNASLGLPIAELGLFFCDLLLDILSTEVDSGTTRTLLFALGSLVCNDEGARVHASQAQVHRILTNLITTQPTLAVLSQQLLSTFTV